MLTYLGRGRLVGNCPIWVGHGKLGYGPIVTPWEKICPSQRNIYMPLTHVDQK